MRTTQGLETPPVAKPPLKRQMGLWMVVVRTMASRWSRRRTACFRVADAHGGLRGVEAVIDKNLSPALLARGLDADALLLLTDVPAIEVDRGRPTARWLASATTDQLAELRLPAGSMGPETEAARRFVCGSGGLAAIGALADAAAILAGDADTRVVPDGAESGSAQHAGALP